jgi:imidazolonepropionase
MKRLFVNIKKLVQTGTEIQKRALSGRDMSSLEVIGNGYLLTDGDKISCFGKMEELENRFPGAGIEEVEIIDVKGKMILPAFCDSHTHLVYAGSREQEFIDKVRGLSYQEIARRGGGILNSARLLHDTSEEELFRQALVRAKEIMSFGTGAVEIKSGYGLNAEDEIKMLRVARRIGEETPLAVKTTFLGAHAVPERYSGNRTGYVDEIVNEMIPAIASERLADYIDVFTEDGFFSVEDTARIFETGIRYGLIPKVHANQMSRSGGVQVGVKYGAISVDHLESTTEEEFRILKDSGTIATLLPGSTFFLNMKYAPARQMIDYGLPVAIATNYNPGSSPSGDMKFMASLAVLKMKMTPEEVINATTVNGACAMGLGATHGSIVTGKKASFIVTREIPSLEYIPYAFSSLLVEQLYLKGERVDL